MSQNNENDINDKEELLTPREITKKILWVIRFQIIQNDYERVYEKCIETC